MQTFPLQVFIAMKRFRVMVAVMETQLMRAEKNAGESNCFHEVKRQQRMFHLFLMLICEDKIEKQSPKKYQHE